jgi:hypothetical protein
MTRQSTTARGRVIIGSAVIYDAEITKTELEG